MKMKVLLLAHPLQARFVKQINAARTNDIVIKQTHRNSASRGKHQQMQGAEQNVKLPISPAFP